jgi:hypothetical protein
MNSKETGNPPVSPRWPSDRRLSPVEQAFAEMQWMLKRIIARLSANPADVEDILQDTYVKAVTGEATTQVRNPRAYLVTVARSERPSKKVEANSGVDRGCRRLVGH